MRHFLSLFPFLLFLSSPHPPTKKTLISLNFFSSTLVAVLVLVLPLAVPVPEQARLLQARSQPVPRLGPRVHPARGQDQQRRREVDVVRVDQPDGHPRVPRERRVHGIVGQHLAEHAVGRVGGHGANGVARVDQLDVRLGDALLQLALQPGPDVGKDRVSRRVALDVDCSSSGSGRAAEKVLPGALGDADDGVALSLDELGEVGDEAACFFFFERKWFLKKASFFSL